MSAWFYILRLKSGRLYSGATTDLTQRWKDHLAGIACRTTALDPPAAMVYREIFDSFSEARHREARVKRWSGQEKEALVRGDHEALCRLAVSHDGTSLPVAALLDSTGPGMLGSSSPVVRLATCKAGSRPAPSRLNGER